MKTTTESKLAEQAYRDYQKATEPTESKLGVCFAFNQYARHYGIPMKLTPTDSAKYAKVARIVIQPFSKWMASEIHNAWKLGGAAQ